MRICLLLLLGLGAPLRAQRLFPLDPSSTPTRPVYALVQEPPQFPGGMGQLTRYVTTNRRYAPAARRAKREGRVLLSFIINEQGAIEAIRLIKRADPALDAEARRLVSRMPQWIPGKIDGQAVACRYNLPVHFALSP